MTVTQTSASSTDTLPRRIPGTSGHTPAEDPNGPAIPRIPGPRKPSGLGPRPAPPARPLSHDLDWDSIPTAPHGPVTMTRQQVRAELAAVEAEGSHERTGSAYEAVVLGYGIPAHLTAFGGAA